MAKGRGSGRDRVILVDRFENFVGVLGNEFHVIIDTGLPSSGTVLRTSVTQTIVNGTTLVAANQNRRGVTIYNAGTKDLYVAFGTGATPTDFSLVLVKGELYEVPDVWVRFAITGVWAAAGVGNAKISEALV